MRLGDLVGGRGVGVGNDRGMLERGEEEESVEGIVRDVAIVEKLTQLESKSLLSYVHTILEAEGIGSRQG